MPPLRKPVLPARLPSVLRLALCVGLCGSLPAFSQPRDLPVRVIWSDGDLVLGVQSEVRLDGSPEWKETDDEGRTLLQVARCDATVTISARPVFDFYEEAVSEPCSPDEPEMILEVRFHYNSTAASIVLDPQTPGRLGDLAPGSQWESLQRAYTAAEFADAARSAADLSFTLRNEAPGLAQSLSVLSMDAGYRALGMDPTAADLPLIAFDPLQEAYVMTPFGAEVYARHAARIEAAKSDRWTFEGLRALPEGGPAAPLPAHGLIRLQDEADLERLIFDSTGRFELRLPSG